MPKLKKHEYKYQFNQDTLWTSVYKLLDKNDPLREEVYNRYEYETTSQMHEPENIFTDKSDIVDINGKVHKNISNADIYKDEYSIDPTSDYKETIDTDDKGYIKYQNNAKDLIGRIRAKYPDKEKHGMLNFFLDTIETNINSVTNGHRGYENTPGTHIIDKQRKMLDTVLNDVKNPAPINTYEHNDPANYEKACKDFGLVKLYNDYNNVAKHNMAWSDEINKKEPDPEKLRQMFELYNKDYEIMGKDIAVFKDKFYEDAKLPKDQRQIYQIAHEDDVKGKDLIGDGGRAIDYAYENGNMEVYRRDCQNQIFGAELMKAKREAGITDKNKSPLAEMTDELIKRCFIERDYISGDKSVSHLRLSDEQRVDKIFELREYAQQHPEDPMSKAVLGVVEKQLADPHNLKVMTEMEEREMYEEAPKTANEISLAEVKAQKQNLKDFANLAMEMIRSIQDESFFFQMDNRGRSMDDKSESYKTLVSALEKLDKASGSDCADIKEMDDLKPDLTMEAMRDVIKAADDYHREHKGMTKGVIGNGRTRYKYSGNIADKLREKMADLEEKYQKAPNVDSVVRKELKLKENDIMGSDQTVSSAMTSLDRLEYKYGKAVENELSAPDKDLDYSDDVKKKMTELKDAFNKNVKGAAEIKEGMDAQEKAAIFDNQKKEFADLASKMIAVKMTERFLNKATQHNSDTLKAAVKDGGLLGKEMKGLLDNDMIKDNAIKISESDSFKRMINGIKDIQTIDKLKNDALSTNGMNLIDELSKQSKIVQREARIKEMAQKNKELEQPANVKKNDQPVIGGNK